MSKKNKAPETLAEETVPAGNSILPWVVGIGTLVVVLGGFAAAVAVIQGGSKEPIRLPEEELKPAAAAKAEPAPWTYDSVTDQHWDPAHKHWHKGHPPNQNAAAPKPIPNIPNPEPWQYDAATDQHFNPEPGHNHWHEGKPPANQATPAAAADTDAPTPVTGAPTPAASPEVAPMAVEEAVEVPTETVQVPETTPTP
jgi:hypothetical protein